MTVRERLEDVLYEFGMFREQAHKVMNVSIPIIDAISDDYQIEWDSDSEIYQDDMYDFLFSLIRPEALKWINENVPKAWFRENFED
jgi:hypothetical protein